MSHKYEDFVNLMKITARVLIKCNCAGLKMGFYHNDQLHSHLVVI